jgi:hypothetical protein
MMSVGLVVNELMKFPLASWCDILFSYGVPSDLMGLLV